jgi:hypothetical protein
MSGSSGLNNPHSDNLAHVVKRGSHPPSEPPRRVRTL